MTPLSRLLIIPLLIFASGAGCSRNSRNPIATKLPDEDWYGQGPFTDTLEVGLDMTSRIYESAGASPFLIVGSTTGLVSRAVLKASIFPAADSVYTANLELRVYDFIDTEEIAVRIYPLSNPDWVEAEATWDAISGRESQDAVPWGTPGGDYDASTLLGQAVLNSSSIDTTVSIPLDISVINAWVDSTRENAGMIMIAESEGLSPGLVEFRSRQSQNAEEYLGPQLYLEYNKIDDPDSVVTGRISVTEDVTLYRWDGEVPPGSFRVGSIPQYRTFFSFDTSGFSPAASVRKATLLLPVLDRVPEDRNMVVGTYEITGDWDGEFTTLNFTAQDTVDLGDGGEVSMGMTQLVWGWVGGSIENHGVAVKSTVERGKYGYVDLGTPRCIVEYTLPPGFGTGTGKRVPSNE